MANAGLQKVGEEVAGAAKELELAERLVLEGILTLVEAKQRTACRAYLLNTCLLLCKEEAEKKTGKFPMVATVVFSGNVRVPEVASAEELHIVTEKGKTLVFTASSPEEKLLWMTAIRNSLDGILPTMFKEVDGEQVWDALGHCTDEQLEAYNAVRKRLQEREPAVTETEWKWLTDGTTLKYLRARSWDVDKAYAMVHDTLVWRAEYKPTQIAAEEIEESHRTGYAYVSNSKDKLGRPLVYMRARLDKAKHSDGKVKHMVVVSEEAARKMDSEHTGVDKAVWLVDFQGKDYGLWQARDGAKTAIGVVGIFQNNYPEALGRAFFIDAPGIFQTLWKLVTPFIDPVTRRKFVFINRKQNLDLMLDYFESDQLEEEFGGTNTFAFDYDKWKAEHEAAMAAETENAQPAA